MNICFFPVGIIESYYTVYGGMSQNDDDFIFDCYVLFYFYDSTYGSIYGQRLGSLDDYFGSAWYNYCHILPFSGWGRSGYYP